ncbi:MULTISPECIES: ABC transporter permease [unclassified Haladaptatus]|uniref:ABC transporter permease n=1 Tax=unclassified Haladaptatus TaxID=2622732 RepID=UPI0023E8F517|nr:MULTISPECIES: ABC transporter permease [unclassified Haladaptatus]
MSRWSYFLRRVLLAIPILVFSSSITFLIIRVGPVDPVASILGPTGSAEAYHEIAVRLGLETPSGAPVPIWEQYFQFLWDLFTFNLGQSWVISPDTTVYEVIATRAPRTIWLGFWSVLIAIFIGIPLGFYAGLHPNTWSDYVASFGGIVWRAMPNFWLAVILVSLLTQSQKVLFGFNWSAWIVETDIIRAPPLTNLSDPERLLTAIKQIMPAALVLGSSSMGNEMRIGRTAVLETINSNYVETARAKGLPRRAIVWKHVFRNALIPLVPIITGEAFLLIGGSVLVETVFAINGIGKLFFDATVQGDLPLVGSLMYIFILLTLSVNILQDFLYTIIDPRVGYDNN